MNNIPKPVVMGITVVVLILAAFVIFRTMAGGGENSAYGSKDEIAKRQAAGMQQKANTDPKGATAPTSGGSSGH